MLLVDHVLHAFNQAHNFSSQLDAEVLALDGMSGQKTRHFYNSLCTLKMMDRPTCYLEVGSWKGSTLAAALYKNPHVQAVVVDNWSQFGGPRADFENTVMQLELQTQVQVYDQDAFSVNTQTLANSVDIYLYDGEHSYNSQYQGIMHYWSALREHAIIIVDDWNWPDVRNGTEDAFKKLNAHIVQKFIIRHTADNSHSPPEVSRQEFWNGMGVFIIDKRQQPVAPELQWRVFE